METYVLIPAWLGFWLLIFTVLDIAVRRKRNPSFKSLLLQLRIWELAVVMLLFFSFTKFEKDSAVQTIMLVMGPMLSLIPILRFWYKRKTRLA